MDASSSVGELDGMVPRWPVQEGHVSVAAALAGSSWPDGSPAGRAKMVCCQGSKVPVGLGEGHSAPRHSCWLSEQEQTPYKLASAARTDFLQLVDVPLLEYDVGLTRGVSGS